MKTKIVIFLSFLICAGFCQNGEQAKISLSVARYRAQSEYERGRRDALSCSQGSVIVRGADMPGFIPVYEQDAKDIVRALEILMPGDPEVYEKSESTSGFGATMTCPPWQKGVTASREDVIEALKQLEWARGVLEKWKDRAKDFEK